MAKGKLPLPLTSFCIKIGAPNWSVAPLWGDLAYGEAVKRELERRGHRCVVQVVEEWGSPEGLGADVAMQLRGLGTYEPRPGQLNVLWSISHPGQLTAHECDRFDLVCCASERFAARLRPATRTPVITLEQATDPGMYFPDPDPAFRHEIVFVGNSRKARRKVVHDLLPTDRDLAVWGVRWEGKIDARHIRGHLPAELVRKAYSSATIVLSDHWEDMREHGYVSDRVFDALACGALVVSDHVTELERFGDAVLTYREPEELHRLVDRFLAAPEEAAERGTRGREQVLAADTFAHRMDALLPHVEERRHALQAGPRAAAQ